MTPDRWQQVAEAFEAALELNPEERRAFLAKLGSEDPFLRSDHKREAMRKFEEYAKNEPAEIGLAGKPRPLKGWIQ